MKQLLFAACLAMQGEYIEARLYNCSVELETLKSTNVYGVYSFDTLLSCTDSCMKADVHITDLS